MSVIRVGSSSTYATGWDAIFGGATSRTGTKKAVAKKPATKKTAKKRSTGNVAKAPKQPARKKPKGR
jgi:hypothetical protein